MNHFILIHVFEFWFKIHCQCLTWELLTMQNLRSQLTAAESKSPSSQVPQVILRHFKVGEALA